MINPHSQTVSKFEYEYSGPFQVIGRGATEKHVIVDRSRIYEKPTTNLTNVSPYLVYLGFVKFFDRDPDFKLSNLKDYSESKFNKQKYYNEEVGSFPVLIIDFDKINNLYFVKFANGEVNIVRFKKDLHKHLLRDFEKKYQVERLLNDDVDIVPDRSNVVNIDVNLPQIQLQSQSVVAPQVVQPNIISNEAQRNVDLQFPEIENKGRNPFQKDIPTQTRSFEHSVLNILPNNVKRSVKKK